MASNINTLASGYQGIKSGAYFGGQTEDEATTSQLQKATSIASGATRNANSTKISQSTLNDTASYLSGAKKTLSSSSSKEDSSSTVAPNEDIYNKFMETVGPYVNMSENEKKYYYNMSGMIMQNGGDAESWAEDFLAKNAVANVLGVSRSTVEEYTPQMMEYYLGVENEKYLNFTTGAALINSFQQGLRQQEQVSAQEKLISLYKNGHTDSSPDVQRMANAILQKDREMSYYQDSTPRWVTTEWAKSSLQQLPYMAVGTVAGIAGNIIGGAAGSIFPGIGTTLGAQIGGAAARFLTYDKQFEASAFWNMKQAGVSTETALKFSDIDGLVNGLNEAFLDVGYSQIMGIAGKVTGIKDLGGKLIPNITTRIIKDGSLGSFLGKFFLYMGLDASGEFVQESTQSLTSAALQAMAEYEDGIRTNYTTKEKVKEAFSQAWDEGVQGFMTGLFFGGATSAVSIAVDYKTSTNLKNNAIRALSEESYVKNKENRKAVQSLRLGGEELSEEQIDSLLSGLYKSSQSARNELKNNVRKEIFEQLKDVDGTLDETSVLNRMIISDREIKNESGEVISGKNTAVKTREDGSLYFVVDKNSSSSADGNTSSYTMRIANPSVVGTSALGELYVDAKVAGIDTDPDYTNTGAITSLKSSPKSLAMEQAGRINFTINEENKTLTIDSVSVQEDSKTLKTKAIQELTAMYPEYTVEWENRTESDNAVYADIESANPRNTSQQTFGLNYNEELSSDDADTAYVKRWLGTNFSEDSSENNFMATMLKAAAKARGMDGKSFIEKYFTAIEKSEDKDSNTKGYMTTERDKVTKQVKATIYAGKNADATTFLHELHHAIMLMGDNMKEFTQIYNKVKGTKQFMAFLKENIDLLKERIAKRDTDGKFILDEKGRYSIDETKVNALFKSSDKWTEDDFEFEARLYEAYVRNGRTFNPSLTGFFRRVAETFRQIYRSLRNGFFKTQLNDEVVAYFDKLYGYDATTGTTSQLNGDGSMQFLKDAVSEESGEGDNSLKQTEIEKRRTILEEVLNSTPIVFNGDYTVSGDPKQAKSKAFKDALNSVRGTYKNKETGKYITLTRRGVKEVLNHDSYSPNIASAQIKSVFLIPDIIRVARPFATENNEDTKADTATFNYYLSLVSIDGKDYLVRSSIIEANDGTVYYDHKLTNKGSLNGALLNTNPGFSPASSNIDDKRLLSLLQEKNNGKSVKSLKQTNLSSSDNILYQSYNDEFSTADEAQEELNRMIEKFGAPVIEEGKIRMNVSTVQELYALAEEAQPEFTSIINNLQIELGIEKDRVSSRDTLKKNNRVLEKTVNDYKRDIGRVLDVNGSTFTLNNFANAESTYRKALEILGKEPVANNKECNTPAGYKDFKINIRTSNGFIGELIILDENTAWMKNEGIGHKIYDVTRKFEPYLKEESGVYKKYQSLFGMGVWNAIKRLNDSLNEWSKKAYENAEAIRKGQYDNAGFAANLYAVSSDITELFNQLRSNRAASYAEGLSSYTLPSDATLNIDNSQDSSSLLYASSQISKYLTAIENNSSNSNVTQNSAEVNSINPYKPESFDNEINDIFENRGGSKFNIVVLSKTSNVYKELGLYGEEFVVRRGSIIRHRTKYGHLATAEEWIRLANNFDKPIGYFVDDDGKYHIYFNVRNESGETLMALVEERKRGPHSTSNYVVTAFYRRNYDRDVATGLIKKINQPSVQWHQLPSVLPSSADSNSNISLSSGEVNSFTKAEAALSEKYRERFVESVNKRLANQDEEKAIKEIVQSYPRHEVSEGVEMLDGLLDDKHDMPMQKEYLTARLMTELFGEKLILLPRYMDRMLNRIAGFNRFTCYSLSDGISALDETQKTYEFKFVGSEKKGARRLKTACAKADVGVVVFSSPYGFDRFDVSWISPEDEVYIINVYGGDVAVKYKKASNEWRVHPDSKSRLKPEISSSIKSIASELQKVNPEDQTSMDYAVYSASSDRENAVRQAEAESQRTIQKVAESGTRLNQIGDDEWTETAKRIALEAGSIEDFFKLYRERIESGDTELSDSNTSLLLSDIYEEERAKRYDNLDDYYDSAYEELLDEDNDTAETISDDWVVEEVEDDNTTPVFATSDSDIPDWFDIDDSTISSISDTSQTTEENIKAVEEAVTEVQKVVTDGDLPKGLSLEKSRSLDTSVQARAVEFASILKGSKEETIKFLKALKDVNDEFFYDHVIDGRKEVVDEATYQMQEERRTAYDEFSNISKFIQNLVFDSKGSKYANRLNNLSDRAWKIVAGQVASNPEVYMDLYSRASNNSEWAGDNSVEAKVISELGLTKEEWNNASYYKRKMYAQDVADKELRGKIMSGQFVDSEIREWIKRSEDKAEASLSEAKAIEESQKYTIDENKKTILKLSNEAQEAQKKINELKDEQSELQDRIDKAVTRMERKLKKNGTPTETETAEHGELVKRMNELKRRQAQYERTLESYQNRYSTRLGDVKNSAATASDVERIRALVDSARNKITELEKKNILSPEEALERLENLHTVWKDAKTKEAIDEVSKHYQERLKDATKDKHGALNKQHEELSDHYQQRLKDATTKKNEALDEQRRELSAHYKDRLKNATIDKHDALKKARERYMADMKERDALRKTRAEKERLARQIMKAPSSSVALEEAKAIKAVQALLDPAHRRSSMTTIDGVTYSVDELKRILSSNPNDPVLQTLTGKQLERLTKKSLNEMTLAEVEGIYQTVLKLREEGIEKRRSEIVQRKAENKIIREALMNELRSNPKYEEYGFEGTEDRKNREKTKKSKIRDAWYNTLNMARKAQTLDNGEKGTFYNLLIRKKRLLENEEMRAVMERSKKIDDVVKDNKFKKDSLYKTWTVKFEDGRDVTFTTSELAYVYLSQNNEDNRDALAYGTFINVNERANIIASAEKAIIGTGKALTDARNNKIDEDIRALGDWRYNEVLSLAKTVVEGDQGLFKLVKAIESDFNDPSFSRVVNLVRKIYNVEVKKEDYYLPISRTDFMGKEPGEDIKNDLLNTVPGTKGSVSKGFTKERIKIAPRNQKSIRYDLFKVWTDAVKKQEHFVAMQEYVNQLNSIFEVSNTDTNVLREGIRNTYGENMLKDIDTHILEIADPNAGAVQSDPARDILKAAKGNIYSAYLGWKLSSITNQLITSPAAFFGKVGPIRYAKNLLQMTTSFKKTSEEVFKLSPFMKSRNFDLIAGEIKEAAEAVGMPKYKKVWNNFLEFGLKGLEWVDQYTVVAGWKAIYEQELERLGSNSEENIRKAVQIADEYTQETQPQSNKTELAPLYKNKNEMLNILLQFQTSLNVVWNNLAYDTVHNFKRGDLRTALGTMAGYATAGALLSLAHGEFQPDDDDDDYSFWRTFLYSTVSQGVESIPVFSSYVDSIFGYVVNNEKPGFNTTSITPFPMLASAFESGKYTIQAIKEKNTEALNKAVEKGADALMLGVGLPYSGVKELKAIQDRGVQALIGAR